MKATLKRLISSSTTTIVLLLVYGAGLAIATFIEKYHGTAAAKLVGYRYQATFAENAQMGNVSYSRGFHSNSAGSIGISSLG